MISTPDIIAYWDRQPCNIKHSAKPIGTKEFFDEVEKRKYFVEPHIKEFAQFERWSNKHVLEIGCGIGTDAINFKRAGASYLGIDVSQASVELTNVRFQLEGYEARALQYNAEDSLISLTGVNSLDLVYAFGVLHHTLDPRRAIKNIRQVIKEDGELRIMLYSFYSWKYMMIREGLDQFEAQAGCPITHTFTVDTVNELLRGYFEVDSLRQTHIFPYVIDDYKKHTYRVQPYFQAMGDELFKVLEKNLGWHLLIVAKPI